MHSVPIVARAIGVLERRAVCRQCRNGGLASPFLFPICSTRRTFRHATNRRQNVRTFSNAETFWNRGTYFSANALLADLANGVRGKVLRLSTKEQSTSALEGGTSSIAATTQLLDTQDQSSHLTQRIDASVPPLTAPSPRPRRRRKDNDQQSTAEPTIPLDASNQLSTLGASMPTRSLKRLLTIYLSLSKPRLTFLIVLTTTAAYSIYPVPSLLSTTATHTPSLSTLTLLFLTTGTFLTSASANALNMLLEPAHDAKMSRTRNRPLVRGLISKRGALLFAVVAGLAGTAALYTGVNPTTAALAFSNILLYAFVYTPLKRTHVINTWVGAVVGGIPPLMGWTAAAGQSATGNGDWKDLLFGDGSAGGWLLAALLYAWQFPHFNALSWTIREEYKHAGYKMLAWTNPARNGRVALRYSILMIPICVGLAYCGVVEKAFVPASMVANGWMLYEAVKFYRYQGTKGSARGLFWASVWHLPIVLVLAMTLKKGLWERVWASAFGQSEDIDEDWLDDEDEVLGTAAYSKS